MKIGDIYNYTENRIRILMFDDKEVFYQIVNKDDTFVYAKYKTISYYRASKEHFKLNSNFIKSLELEKKELEIHRPDLPLRLNCFSVLFWVKNSFEKKNDFENFLKSFGINKEELTGLDINKVVVIPTTQQLTSKKPTLLQNEKGYFIGEELMIECFRIQSEYVNLEKPYFSKFRLIPLLVEKKKYLLVLGFIDLGLKETYPLII